MQSRTINFYTFIRLAGILLGTATAAFGVVAFVLPSGIMIGSCTGIARIVPSSPAMVFCLLSALLCWAKNLPRLP